MIRVFTILYSKKRSRACRDHEDAPSIIVESRHLSLKCIEDIIIRMKKKSYHDYVSEFSRGYSGVLNK